MGFMTGRAMSSRNVAFEGGKEVWSTSMAEEVPTFTLRIPRDFRACLMRRMAGTRWRHVALVLLLMTSFPTKM